MNDIRRYLDILTESRVIKVEFDEYTLPIVVNPTANQLHNLLDRAREGELRGLAFPNGDLYVWDAYDATHADVRHKLGMYDAYGLELFHDSVELEREEFDPEDPEGEAERITNELSEHRGLNAAYGGSVPLQVL